MISNIEPIEVIKNTMLDHIEVFISQNGEFYPFGILLSHKGETRSITVIDNDIKQAILDNKGKIEELVCKNYKYHSGGYCVDTIVNGISKIQMNLISQTSKGWIRFYLSYIFKDGRINYGEFEME